MEEGVWEEWLPRSCRDARDREGVRGRRAGWTMMLGEWMMDG